MEKIEARPIIPKSKTSNTKKVSPTKKNPSNMFAQLVLHVKK